MPLGVSHWVDLLPTATAIGACTNELWSCLELLDRQTYPLRARMMSGRATARRVVEIVNSTVDRSTLHCRGHADLCIPDFRQLRLDLPHDGWEALQAIEHRYGYFGR